MKYNHVIILLIISIIGLVVSTQLLVHQHIKNQEEHFTIINNAGKQRALSQVITKKVLNIQKAYQKNLNYENLNAELRNLVDEFSTNHERLKNRNSILTGGSHNSKTTQLMFEDLEESSNVIKGNATRLIVEKNSNNIGLTIKSILHKEESFLSKMDAITGQYNLDFVAKNKELAKIHSRRGLALHRDDHGQGLRSSSCCCSSSNRMCVAIVFRFLML